MADCPYDIWVGKLWPGAFGWLPLDDAGYPNGIAHPNPPTTGSDVKACHVMCNATIPLPAGHCMLLTSSGAPISPPLNSNVDKRADLESQYKSPPAPDGWEESDEMQRRTQDEHNKRQFRNRD